MEDEGTEEEGSSEELSDDGEDESADEGWELEDSDGCWEDVADEKAPEDGQEPSEQTLELEGFDEESSDPVRGFKTHTFVSSGWYPTEPQTAPGAQL